MQPRPSAIVPASQGSNDFKNSLAAMLAKGAPQMPGARRPTIQPQSMEESKNNVAFDDGGPDYKKKTVLDNVRLMY